MKKEIMPLLLLLGAIIAFSLVSSFGIVYNVGKSIYECLRLRPAKAIGKFFMYWLKFLYQIWNVVKYGMLHAAIAFDLFGNVSGGEMIEDCVTTREDTLYGKGNWTVSAATGKEEQEGFLVPFGKKFTWMLSKVLGQGHSVEAYLSSIKK